MFGDPAESDYLLPFAVGRSRRVSQNYCFQQGGHRNQLAVDFVMPIGEDVLAARAGLVLDLREDSPDTGEGEGEHNYVFIQHTDGTVAFYAHLQQNGVLVNVGQEVAAREVIATAGNSGLTGIPHLHFGVYASWPPIEGSDVPVNFRNAAGPYDERNGPIMGMVYTALEP